MMQARFPKLNLSYDAYMKISNSLESFADYTEDCSDALVLSAHGPFRIFVISELKAIGIE